MTARKDPQRSGQRRIRKHSAKRSASDLQQLDWRLHQSLLKPVDVLSQDQLSMIHDSSMRILEEIGIEFLCPEARMILRQAGADVNEATMRVKMDRNLVMSFVQRAPSEFTLHARNADKNLHVGGNSIVFGCVASAPNATDLDNGRRSGNQHDFRQFLKLAQTFNIIQTIPGYPVEPIDVPFNVRHLECTRDFITYTDKVFHVYSLGAERNLDAIEMVRIARGIDLEQLKREPSLYTVVNANSPLRYDTPMLQGLKVMAEYNQLSIITPFTLAGAMAPVSIAGAIAQQNAEALAGIAFCQMVNPGCPVVYGGFTSNVDMKSGAPAFGTPEYMKSAMISGQLCRHYKLPFRSSNVNAANSVDAQAAYESVFSLWGLINGHCNFVMHGAGWLEGGLSASFEKFIIDCDLLQMVAEYLKPIQVSDDEIGLTAINDVGPGGHFFGTDHTLARYQNAFYAPIVSDWRNFETWSESGAPTAAMKANKICHQILSHFKPPPLSKDIKEELDAFVAKRTAQGGAPNL